MALPNIMRRLFRSDGYGPLLKDEIVSKHISVQDWSSSYDYPVATVVRGSDGLLYWSVAQSGPSVVAGAQDPTADDGTYWTAMPLNDADVVHITKDEQITGRKDFANSYILQRDVRLDNGYDAPTATLNSYFAIHGAGNVGSYPIDRNVIAQIQMHNTASWRSLRFMMRAYNDTATVDTGLPSVGFTWDNLGYSFKPFAAGIRLGTNDTNGKWKEIWCAQNSINSTSDERQKQAIENIDDDVLDAWGDVQWCEFKWNDAVLEKGADNARLHSGLIAQHVASAFAARGLDIGRYGFFLHDSWDGDEEMEAGDAYGLRYVECLCIEAAYQRRRADRAEARIASLEARLAALEAKLNG